MGDTGALHFLPWAMAQRTQWFLWLLWLPSSRYRSPVEGPPQRPADRRKPALDMPLVNWLTF